ncbi:MAG: tetraacyldisaccharide 4'-kinase [Burkholderiales bacterium PBB4]|nr:MAG: tetraacyldisaccharide 4'-kinase [Burkholderiales bacterium PBB4]
MQHQTQQGLLRQIWGQRGLLALLLYPIACLYGLAAGTRRRLYRWGLKKTHGLSVPVVVVGNVVVGGSGKTPATIAITQHLLDRGWSVGVVSRGYGRRAKGCLEVTTAAPPRDVGDEPLLIHHKTGAPVFVAAKRFEAASALLQAHPQTQVIVCDDGLQHYALHRDLELCVFDDRGCGNGWLLPAGPLREHWPRSLVLQSGQSLAHSMVLHTGESPAFLGWRGHRKLASYALQHDGSKIPLADLTAPGAPPLIAVAGISQPEAFFSMLRANGIHLVETHALSDHYDFDSWSRTFHGAFRLICTEKDALKLWRIAPHALAVPLEFEIEPAFWEAFDPQLEAASRSKLSSPYGHSIT